MLAETTLRTRILDQAHQVVGHYGPQRTSDYIRQWYWWLHIYKLCKICTQAKGEYQKPVGKLHPLPIVTRPWELIGMDFIGPLLEVNGYNYLWVVICRMTSMVHLVPVNMKMTVSQLSAIYVWEIVQLHGLLSLIICNWDSKFTLKWWHELHRIMGTKLLMSTSFHPQMDGAMERANRSIGQMFWALIKPDQKCWWNCQPSLDRKENRIPSKMGCRGFHMGAFNQLQWVGGAQ